MTEIYQMQPSSTYSKLRRRILEDLLEQTRTSPEKPFVNYRNISLDDHWSSDVLLEQLDILQDQGRVELRRMGDECVVMLTPLGRISLEIPEDEWLKERSWSVANTTHLAITHSQIGNVAQVSGSYGTYINQAQSSPDLQTLTSAIDSLVEAVKTNTAVNPDVKNDAQIEANQLKGELQKSKPSPSRIQQALDWFKALDGAAKFMPYVVEVADKVKAYLRGVL